MIKLISDKKQVIAIIILLTLGIYFQTLQFDFLNFDDNFYIYFNPYLAQGLNWSSLKWAFSPFGNIYDPYYMPLTWLSFLIDAQLFGVTAKGFHFTNMLLHLANSLLVLYVLNSMTGRFKESAIVAILFAIHPQHVEAVTWIAERKEVLSVFFGLMALASYSKYCNVRHTFSKQPVFLQLNFLLTFLFFFLSLLTKPTMVTLPCLLLLLDWWPFNRYKTESIISVVIEKIPFFLLSLVLMLIVLHSLKTELNNPIITSQNLPLIQRISNTFVIYVSYLGNTFLPLNMPGWYPYPMHALPKWQFFGSASILLITSLITLLYMRTQPYLFMGWSWFMGMLLPAASVGVYANGDVFTADRWTYFPHIGLFVALVWSLSICVEKWPVIRPWITVLVVSLISLLWVTSFYQIKYWENSETYWLHVLEADNNSHFPNFMLGTYYRDTGRVEESLARFTKAHNNLPTQAYYILEMSNAYEGLNKPDKAKVYYDSLLTLPYVPNDLLTKMGVVNARQGRFQQAKDSFYKILENKRSSSIDPAYNEAHFYLGHIFGMTNNEDESLKEFTKYLSGAKNTKKAQCGNALALTVDLIEYGGIPFEKLKKPYDLLGQLCSNTN